MLTRSEFRNHAVALPVVINGVPHTAVVKEFGTGSLGWNVNAKTEVTINGKPVGWVQSRTLQAMP
jgi:hypothetical protein